MRLAIILICILTINSQAQSVFKFIGKGRKLKVERRIATSVRYHNLARKVLRSQTLTTIRPEAVRHPTRVVGPNTYLKGVGKRFRGLGEWNKVGDSRSYNGAHHIVTKFVIKELGGNSECIRQAPSVFHSLHNDLRHIDWFHNHQKQLEIYKQSGIKGIIEDFFNNVGKDFTDAEKEQLLLEAELWAKHWGFKWE
jgi:hypothetical protein